MNSKRFTLLVRQTPGLSRQRGATLLVGMIMLVVLTLLVVFAIRSSNTGLQVAGNMQAQVEINGATARAMEAVIQRIRDEDMADLVASLNASPNQTVTVGDKTFTVAINSLTCEIEVPVLESTLDASNAEDLPCYGDSGPQQLALTASDALTSKPSECQQQRWKIQAAASDLVTGAATTHVQGLSIRVPKGVACP